MSRFPSAKLDGIIRIYELAGCPPRYSDATSETGGGRDRTFGTALAFKGYEREVGQ